MLRLIIVVVMNSEECEGGVCAVSRRSTAEGGVESLKKIGRGERIRTSGLYVPNVALYQAKLHPECST
jgi:hypothetical protein